MAGAVLAALLVGSCQTQNSADKQPSYSRLPTATEIFDLRSKCAAQGEKVMEENFIGNALAQEQTSRYSPETNRCYVKLDVHTANLNTPQENFTRDEFLFDGQTKELLLSASWRGNQKSSVIESDSLRKFFKNPALPSYDEADAVIDKFMAEDRKP